jgi:hypothetical protein
MLQHWKELKYRNKPHFLQVDHPHPKVQNERL